MPDRLLGYCTNVHPGATRTAVEQNLAQHAVRVRQLLGQDELPVGLWLCDATSRDLTQPGACEAFRAFLHQHGLRPFTFNGFPFADFHQPVVKHAVYEPSWATPQRYDYTLRLAHLLSQLLPDGDAGSISTLPIGWNTPREAQTASAAAFRKLASALTELEDQTGHCIHIDIEPEPGCTLGTSSELVEWYQRDLLKGGNEHQIRRHIRVCHDVCHAAVMFEPQAEVVARYRAAGIAIGKVQISSAPAANLDVLDASQRAPAMHQLKALVEPRYLHQTSVRHKDRSAFYEDLPQALDAETLGAWRVHFHLPVYLQTCGALGTTQADIIDLLNTLDENVTHLEVETYAWSVLPKELQQEDLAEGIAHELKWTKEMLT